MKNLPHVREEQRPGDEGFRAHWWRTRIAKLTVKELSDATGYSVAAVRSFEANCNSVGELIGPDAWKRYRLTCAAVEAKLTEFNWGK